MIYIDVLNKVWDVPYEDSKFEDYLASLYVVRVKEAITFNLYGMYWKKLNPKYEEYKLSRGYSLNQWEATEALKEHLKVKSNRVIGFDNRLKHYSHMRYRDLARILEYGNFRVPARPLFRYVLNTMIEELPLIYEGYCLRR